MLFPITETFAERNQNTTVADATALAGRLVERARLDEGRVSITLSAAFGCPFEGRVEPEVILALAERVGEARPDEIVLADTIRVGVPKGVRELVAGVLNSGVTVGCHFHDTRNTGIANAIAAVEAGATCSTPRSAVRAVPVRPQGYRQHRDGGPRVHVARDGTRDGDRAGRAHRVCQVTSRTARQRAAGTGPQGRQLRTGRCLRRLRRRYRAAPFSRAGEGFELLEGL